MAANSTAYSATPVARRRDSLRNSVIRNDSQPRSVSVPPPNAALPHDASPQPHAAQLLAVSASEPSTSPVGDDIAAQEEFALTSLPAEKRQAENNSVELTPFMRQWTAAKKQNPDALLFFRMGDFYELFYDDAAVASRELQLTLTARDKEKSQPMCGMPYHSAEIYMTRLLRKGYRIAICEQMEDPKLTKKIVRRDVIRVLTPDR